MTTWSKSPAAQARRAASRPPELLHYSAPDQPHNNKRTACGRLYSSNTTMWMTRTPTQASCPRCQKALQRLSPEPIVWTPL